MPSTPSRYTSGVSTVLKTSTLGMFGAPDPTKFHIFFDDFDNYVAADWTVTLIGAGGTAALADADGGVLTITTDALDNDQVTLQKVGESFKLEAGKRAWFKTRFKVADATQSDLAIGLQITDTTPLACTDGVWFRKDDGDALIDFIVQKDDTTGKNTSLGVATLVDDTYIVLGWYYDGVSSVEVFVNDAKVATVAATSTYLPDTELTLSMSYANGEAGAIAMSVDYLFAAKER